MSSSAYIPLIAPHYVPYEVQSDREVQKHLEADIIAQWAEEGGPGMPPEFGETEATAAGNLIEAKSEAQAAALNCEADILLYGGAAGSLKSFTILVDAAVEYENPNLNFIIFRQSFPELRDLVKKSMALYPKLGGKFVKSSPMCWTFPSGATIWLGYMGHDDDVYAHQGSEYSGIDFDEAGHQNEFRIRYMLSRLRSTDPTLKLRMRLTANPGGPGHAFLMKMFLKGVCPHCEPTRAVQAGKLYYDAVWPSDKQPLTVTLPGGKRVARSVAFIPGKVTDHDLLGDGYVANLMTQAAATASKLLDGCWKEWEGQFFDCFSETRGIVLHAGGAVEVLQPDIRMVVPLEELDIKYWYPHFIGGDYGFSISAAAAHLGVRLPATPRFPNGRIAIIDEYLESGVTGKDYAKNLIDKWFLDGYGQVPDRPRSIQMWAVSPDAFRKDGSVNDVDVPFSRIEQMNEALAPYGMAFIMANNDRVGGWMKMYQMLRDGELIIAKHCVNTIEMLQTRIRDPKKFDDILKVSGDPLDDSCLSADTLVRTDCGLTPISQVTTAHLVLTRKGWRRVLWSGCTAVDAPTLIVLASSGEAICCTPAHPFFVASRGFIRADQLNKGDSLQPCPEHFQPLTLSVSPSMASPSAVIRTRDSGAIRSISRLAQMIARQVSALSIRRYGRAQTAPSRSDSTFIIAMATAQITVLKIWSVRLSRHITAIICGNETKTPSRLPALDSFLIESVPSPKHGIAAKREESGTGSIVRFSGRIRFLRLDSAPIADQRTTLSYPNGDASVPTTASQPLDARPRWITRIAHAWLAEVYSKLIGTAKSSDAGISVVGVYAGPKLPVYNLQVEGEHEFYANGVLTHNCDSIRYAVMTWPMQSVKPKQERIAEAIEGLDPMNTYLTIRQIEIADRGSSQVATSLSRKQTRGRFR